MQSGRKNTHYSGKLGSRIAFPAERWTQTRSDCAFGPSANFLFHMGEKKRLETTHGQLLTTFSKSVIIDDRAQYKKESHFKPTQLASVQDLKNRLIPICGNVVFILEIVVPIMRYHPWKLLMKCFALLMNHSLGGGFPSLHMCLFGPISCDILQNHITRLGAMEPLIYWAGDHCYLGVSSFDSAARVPVVRRAGRSTCASLPCAAELKLGD